MRFNYNILSFLLSFSVLFVACKKDDSKKDYGFSTIYMPQAIVKSGGVDHNYPVPSGTDSSSYNYQIDRKTDKINIILGAALSGPGKDAFSVDIQVDNDTVQQLLTNGTFNPATYKLLPASMYTLPAKLEVPAGQKGNTFFLSVDIPQLKLDEYVGKFLVLAVKLANPSAYELNQSVRSTIVIIDVNALVIGPAVNVTGTYILNPGNPFVASAMNGTRWGTLKDWKTSPSVLSHGGVGGFCSDGDGKTMNMESGWGSPQILNGKIYQTINLPEGTYSFDPSGGGWKWQGLKDLGYAVVAPDVDELPDYANIPGNTAIFYKNISQPQTAVTFELTAPTKVTLGVVVNYAQNEQGFKSPQVVLYNYPKHL